MAFQLSASPSRWGTLAPPTRRCLVTRVAVDYAGKQWPKYVVVSDDLGADAGTAGTHPTRVRVSGQTESHRVLRSVPSLAS